MIRIPTRNIEIGNDSMPTFYCSCGDMIDDPDEEECSVCRDDDTFCEYCGEALDSGIVCEPCQEMLDDDDPLLDEEDEEFLRGPF